MLSPHAEERAKRRVSKHEERAKRCVSKHEEQSEAPAPSIRGLFPLRQAGLAQTLSDARYLLGEDGIVAE
jgi:hypothetical protein